MPVAMASNSTKMAATSGDCGAECWAGPGGLREDVKARSPGFSSLLWMIVSPFLRAGDCGQRACERGCGRGRGGEGVRGWITGRKEKGREWGRKDTSYPILPSWCETSHAPSALGPAAAGPLSKVLGSGPQRARIEEPIGGTAASGSGGGFSLAAMAAVASTRADGVCEACVSVCVRECVRECV